MREQRYEQDAPQIAQDRVKQDVQNGVQLALHPPVHSSPSDILAPGALPNRLPPPSAALIPSEAEQFAAPGVNPEAQVS